MNFLESLLGGCESEDGGPKVERKWWKCITRYRSIREERRARRRDASPRRATGGKTILVIIIAATVESSVAVVVSVILSRQILQHHHIHSLSLSQLLPVAVALIVLLVNPLDDVVMAMRPGSAFVSAPRARRVLRTHPFQNIQLPSLRRPSTSQPAPRARRVLSPQPL